jgi:hypothetical protein
MSSRGRNIERLPPSASRTGLCDGTRCCSRSLSVVAYPPRSPPAVNRSTRVTSTLASKGLLGSAARTKRLQRHRLGVTPTFHARQLFFAAWTHDGVTHPRVLGQSALLHTPAPSFTPLCSQTPFSLLPTLLS